MKPAAIVKAKVRLVSLERNLFELVIGKSDIEIQNSWMNFLSIFYQIINILKSGAGGSLQSKQWKQGIESLIENDELLKYVWEARNDSDHGLGISVLIAPERHFLGLSGTNNAKSFKISFGRFQNLTTTINGSGTAFVFEGELPRDLTITSLDGLPVECAYEPRRPMLKDIVKVDRKARKVTKIPTSHLGVKLDNVTPSGIAELANKFVKDCISSAEKLVHK